MMYNKSIVKENAVMKNYEKAFKVDWDIHLIPSEKICGMCNAHTHGMEKI